MVDLDYYCSLFRHLKRAPNKIFPPTTGKKAPHKPLLLLAVIDLIERQQLDTPFISVDAELTELNALFTSYWRRLMPIAKQSSIAFPFSRMNSEPFWELVPRTGTVITQADVQNVSTVIQLRRLAIGARMDEELFSFMSQADGRRQLTHALLDACFSAEGQRVLLEEMGIQEKAYQYSRILEKRAHKVRDGDSQDMPIRLTQVTSTCSEVALSPYVTASSTRLQAIVKTCVSSDYISGEGA